MRRSKTESEQTRCAILDAAELAFCTRGFASTTLEQVSRTAQVTRGAFYWHFKNKTDLLQALHERTFVPQQEIIAAVTEASDADPLARLASAVPCILRSFESDEKQQHMFMIMSDLTTGPDAAAWVARIHAELLATLVGITTAARDNGALQSELTPQDAAIMLMVYINGLLSEWMRSGKAFPLSDLGARLLSRQIASLRVKDAGA